MQALEKKSRAEKLLAELDEEQTLQPPPLDKEGITEEERYMLRKVGLRMKPFLLLGECLQCKSLSKEQHHRLLTISRFELILSCNFLFIFQAGEEYLMEQ